MLSGFFHLSLATDPNVASASTTPKLMTPETPGRKQYGLRSRSRVILVEPKIPEETSQKELTL